MVMCQKDWELPNSPILWYFSKTWILVGSKFSHLDEHCDQLLHLPWESDKKCKIIGLPLLSDTNAARFLSMHVWLFETFSSLTPRETIYLCQRIGGGRELGSPALCSIRAPYVLCFLAQQHQMIDDESCYVQLFCPGGHFIHSLLSSSLHSATATKARLRCQNNLLTTGS